jgi:hypothetical protein
MWSGIVMMKHPVSKTLLSLISHVVHEGFENSSKLQWQLFYVALSPSRLPDILEKNAVVQ